MEALAHGCIDILNELIKAGADLNLKNNYWSTPLMFLSSQSENVDTGSKVISSGCILEMLEILLRQSNIDVNAQDNNGNTALIIAAGAGRIKVVNRLIECKKVKVDIVNNKGNNAIMMAVQNDRKNVVRELLKQEYFRKNINCKNKKEQSVLSIAVVEGYTGLVDLLLKQKDDKGDLIVDINTPSLYGITPLISSLFNNHLEIANKLLDQDRIDVTLSDQFMQTSLMFSAHKGIYSITKKILDRIPTDLRKSCVNIKSLNQVTAMTAAVFNNNAKMVKLLLENDADVNTKFEDETVLMFAARNGFTEIVKLLLDAGADVSIKNNAKETALDIVKELDFRDEIIQLLQKAKPEFPQLGLKAREVNKKFKEAVENKSAENVDQLLHQYNNGNMMVSDESINEMFVKAAGEGSEEIFSLLIPYVKDFNFKDKNGNTALITAAKNGQDFIVSTLLKYPGRININAENEECYTALMVAAEKGYKSIVRELLDKGAKISNSINSEAALSIVSSAKANIKNNKSVVTTYEKIEKLLREKGQKQGNELVMSIGSWAVYAGNEFCDQLADLDKNFPDLGSRVREMVGKLSMNPNYKSDKGDNPEVWRFGCYSRRLNEKHRLIYRLRGGAVQCLFCRDHNKELERKSKSTIDSVVCKYKWEQNEDGK
jgi:serine/threonine-protein phosphatase 6 regulatory ankyrin repeat subunit B